MQNNNYLYKVYNIVDVQAAWRLLNVCRKMCKDENRITHHILYRTQTVMDLNFYGTWNKISREDYGIILCVHKILNICINTHLYGIFVSAASAVILNTAVKNIVVSYEFWELLPLSQPSIPLSKVRRNCKCQGHFVLFHLPLSFFSPSLWSSLLSGDDLLPSFAIIYTRLHLSPSEA